MGTKHHDLKRIQTHLTLTRWHLNAAAHAAAEMVYHHIEQAYRMYEVTTRSLSHLNLEEHERSFLERELGMLRVRLRTELLVGGADGGPRK